MLLIYGNAQVAVGQWSEGRKSYQTALEMSKYENSTTYAQSTLALGSIEFEQSEYKQALDNYAKAEEIFERTGDHKQLISTRLRIADYYLEKKDLDRALYLYTQIREYQKTAGVTDFENTILLMLGIIYRKRGNISSSLASLQECMERNEKQQNQNAVAASAYHLTGAYFKQTNYAEARHLCGKSLALYQVLKDERGISDAYEQLGSIELAEHNPQRALSFFRASLVMRRQLGNQQAIANSLRHMAFAYGALRQYSKAIWCICRSFFFYHRLGLLNSKHVMNSLHSVWYWKMKKGVDK